MFPVFGGRGADPRVSPAGSSRYMRGQGSGQRSCLHGAQPDRDRRRQGYLFDGSVAGLAGSAPGSPLFRLWEADVRPIREFIGALRSVVDLDMPFSGAHGWEAVKNGIQSCLPAVSHLPALLRYGTMTIRGFAAKFKDPSLAAAFNNLVHFGGPDVPLLTVLLPLAYAHRKMAGMPVKGWLAFARAIERRFTELGGVSDTGPELRGS